MTLSRLVPFAAAVLASLGATQALAGSDHGLSGGPPVVVSRPGLPLDPQLLPANSGPGDCVARRVTGPGGAYRWDRVECDREGGWTNFDQWGYGHHRLDVETPPPPLPPPHHAAIGIEGQAERHYEINRHARSDLDADVRIEGQAYATGGGYVAGYAPRDDRYGAGQGYGYERREETYEHSRERYEDSSSSSSYGYGSVAVGQGDRYGPPRGEPAGYGYGYRYAGRDAQGYLVWPGKTP